MSMGRGGGGVGFTFEIYTWFDTNEQVLTHSIHALTSGFQFLSL